LRFGTELGEESTARIEGFPIGIYFGSQNAHCVNIGPDEESEITHTDLVHNAEILSTASPTPVKMIGTSDLLRQPLMAFDE